MCKTLAALFALSQSLCSIPFVVAAYNTHSHCSALVLHSKKPINQIQTAKKFQHAVVARIAVSSKNILSVVLRMQLRKKREQRRIERYPKHQVLKAGASY